VAGVVAGGSGLNGEPPKLARVLSDPSATVIVVEHRDMLERFGVEQLHGVQSRSTGGGLPDRIRERLRWGERSWRGLRFRRAG
jgi:hypothetical protein